MGHTTTTTTGQQHKYTHPRRDQLLAIFHVSEIWMMQQRIKHDSTLLNELQNKKDTLLSIKIKAKTQNDREFVSIFIDEINEQMITIEKTLQFRKRTLKQLKSATTPEEAQCIFRQNSIDLDDLKKQVKIKDVLDIHGVKIEHNNFFKLRPDEKTPSAQFSPDKNLWVDYGNANSGGSVIDLYMQLNNCDVKEAIKQLTILI